MLVMMDVDGVLLDLCSALRKASGVDHHPSSYRDFAHTDEERRVLRSIGFWGALNAFAIPESVSFARKIVKAGHVLLIVSDPWWEIQEAAWAHARAQWLRDVLQVPHIFVPIGRGRTMVKADLYIDDRPDYVETFRINTWSDVGMIFDQPYNRGDHYAADRVTREELGAADAAERWIALR